MSNRVTNNYFSLYAAVAVWSILALLLWTADTTAQGREINRAGWTVRSAELVALFALHDGERQSAEAASQKKDGKGPAVGDRSASGQAGSDAGSTVPGGPAAVSGATPVPPLASASPASEGAIDINRASAAELQQLPGIGPSKAKAIIDYREVSGGFKSPEELMKVKGIGEKTFERLKPRIHIGN